MNTTTDTKLIPEGKLAEITEIIKENPDPIDFCLELSAHPDISEDQTVNKLAWKQWMQVHDQPSHMQYWPK